MRRLICLLAILLLWSAPADAQERGPGYDDTPVLPGMPWRVHDSKRPRPPAVVVQPLSAPVPVPADAILLFDGKSLESWKGRGGKASWKLVDGAMEVNGTGAIETREHFGDCQLHVEWRAPAATKQTSQGRGNSGVFLMGRYEIQVLDSYRNPSYADGQAAAMYGQYPPLVNACTPPETWQAYDIIFEAPRFDDAGKLKRPARVTVFHNGVLVHHAREYLGATTHRRLPKYAAHPDRGPIRLQDHGNPVRFRNIWIRPLTPKEN